MPTSRKFGAPRNDREQRLEPPDPLDRPEADDAEAADCGPRWFVAAVNPEF